MCITSVGLYLCSRGNCSFTFNSSHACNACTDCRMQKIVVLATPPGKDGSICK
ncbi:hypothetical protein MKW98_013493, partial [Papaver atlanticum]